MPYHEYESSVSPKGQITLPSKTRKKLGLKARDKVKIKVFENGNMVIEPIGEGIDSFYRLIPPLKKPLSIEEMREIAYAEVWTKQNNS